LSYKKRLHILTAALFLGVSAIIIIAFMMIMNAVTLPPATDVPEEAVIPTSIAIPGYEGLNLQADKKQQKISLANPKQNQCYFQITLLLEDGTELWKSDLIKPGKTSQNIKLNQKLAVGTYPNAILKYSCFQMNDELTPLNGAETKLTLWVK